MNNEDILKAAQAEKKKNGEYEKEIGRKSALYGTAAGVLLCAIMVILEMFVFKKVDFGKPAIIFLMSCFMDFYEGRKSKNKKMIITGSISLILTIFFLLAYIGELFR